MITQSQAWFSSWWVVCVGLEMAEEADPGATGFMSPLPRHLCVTSFNMGRLVCRPPPQGPWRGRHSYNGINSTMVMSLPCCSLLPPSRLLWCSTRWPTTTSSTIEVFYLDRALSGSCPLDLPAMGNPARSIDPDCLALRILGTHEVLHQDQMASIGEDES